ncbi:hypothetical protein TNCV_822601 [Trichonephila clavipes]|nr:hypothetical protein TNCV_822601 [Trichonephila clavipes]
MFHVKNNPCGRLFSIGFSQQEEKHFVLSGTRISTTTTTTVSRQFHNAGIYTRGTIVCVSMTVVPIYVEQESVFAGPEEQWVSVLFTDKYRFILKNNSGCLLI